MATQPTTRTTRTTTSASPTVRVPLQQGGVLASVITWWSKRAYGMVMEPALAMAVNRKVAMTMLRYETSVAKWDALDETLKQLATLSAAATVQCSWCLDFGYWVSHTQGIDRQKLEDITDWRRSDAYTPLERLVIEYAQAMSSTPPQVTDAMVATLREHLDDDAVMELTGIIAVENQRSRINSALGFTSQGFKDQCDLRPVPNTAGDAAS